MSRPTVRVLAGVALAACAAVAGCNAGAQPGADKKKGGFAEDTVKGAPPAEFPFDPARAVGYVRQLCDIGPRVSGTPGMAKQIELVEKHFKDHGATVTRQEFKARQASKKEPVAMTNLIVSWQPAKEKRVLFCSHYDTRPIADQEDDRARWNRPFVSANDGTSGVALFMELAHHMKGYKGDAGIDFILFDGEEYVFETSRFGGGDRYFIGSDHFADEYARTRDARKHRYAGGVLLDLFGAKGAKLKVEANSMDGTSLTLDPTKPMMVSIPASTTGAGMQLFLSPSGTNWSATGQAAQVSAGDVRYALPPYPSYNSPRFEAPCYKPTKKFHAPPDPVLPSEPVLPDRVDYVREPKWFEFLWAGRVSQQNEKRYANALRNFEHAREKYHDRWEDYQRDCSSMADRLSEWKRKEDRRQHALVQDSLRWRSEVYDVAFAKHQRECAAYDRAYQQRVRAYERRCDELKGEWAQRLDSLGLASGTDLGRYVFSVSGMGWVNCDRFIDVAADQRFTAVVPDRERSTDNVYVIFNDINSILPMHRRADGDLVCEGIPTGLRATVLALRVQDEKVMMSLRPLEQRGPCALDFKPSSFLEVQQTLQRLRNERG